MLPSLHELVGSIVNQNLSVMPNRISRTPPLVGQSSQLVPTERKWKAILLFPTPRRKRHRLQSMSSREVFVGTFAHVSFDSMRTVGGFTEMKTWGAQGLTLTERDSETVLGLPGADGSL